MSGSAATPRTADERFYEIHDCIVQDGVVSDLEDSPFLLATRCFAALLPGGPKKTSKNTPGCAPEQLWDPEGRLHLVGYDGEPSKSHTRLGVRSDEKGVYVTRKNRSALELLTRWLPWKAYKDTLSSMVPASSWGASLHRLLDDARWQTLRSKTFAACGHRCEVCGAAGPLECHELWSYNEPMRIESCGVQRLEKLIGLYSACHETQHLGFAKMSGRLDQALAHLALLNDWTEDQVSRHYRDCAEEFMRRSQSRWMLDLGHIDVDITVRRCWQLNEGLWLSTQGRAGPAVTKLLAVTWRSDGEQHGYASKLSVKLLRNMPQS
ncbi:hypothetical protein [Massilia aquatica]|uniref:Uncharacterized protein n=1 Tax=Massilia aquatica TaxID=2609000 RepID=A0ABX0MIL2_9BURK|nr:hypothetical protein [Massilia aquatica]NHZ44718.1 hypothetical protein [Massilia aquatica]